MKSHWSTLSVPTGQKQELLNLTDKIGEIAETSGVEDGFIGIYSQHTTAGVFVSEYQEALNDDVLAFLGRVVGDDHAYKHNCPEFSDCERKNAASHLRSLIFIQSVILAELDGPRERMVQVQILGE
jgi:secondary thiamine-phosphate synthase enzyme